MGKSVVGGDGRWRESVFGQLTVGAAPSRCFRVTVAKRHPGSPGSLRVTCMSRATSAIRLSLCPRCFATRERICHPRAISHITLTRHVEYHLTVVTPIFPTREPLHHPLQILTVVHPLHNLPPTHTQLQCGVK